MINYCGALTLRQDKSYSARIGHVDWSCVMKGQYEIAGDTIFLEHNILEQTDSIISGRYLISGQHLLPLDRVDYQNNKEYWMEIKTINNDHWGGS